MLLRKHKTEGMTEYLVAVSAERHSTSRVLTRSIVVQLASNRRDARYRISPNPLVVVTERSRNGRDADAALISYVL